VFDLDVSITPSFPNVIGARTGLKVKVFMAGVRWREPDFLSMFQVEKSELTKSLHALDNQVLHSDGPFPKSAFTWAICGGRGAGKSTLLLNLLETKFRGYFDKIWLISPTALRDSKFKRLLKEIEGQHLLTPDDESINMILDDCKSEIDEAKEAKEEKPNFLIILDDCLHLLPKSQQKNAVNELMTCHRHVRCTVILLSQKYNKLNPLIRSNLDCISMFRTNNQSEKKCFLDDIAHDVEDVYDFAADAKSNSFLHINLAGGPKFFKKFDRIKKVAT
jgi:hypothetical protein